MASVCGSSKLSKEEIIEKDNNLLCLLIGFFSLLTFFPIPKLFAILSGWQTGIVVAWIELIVSIGVIIAWNKIRNAGDQRLAKENLTRLAKITCIFAITAVLASFVIDPMYQEVKKATNASSTPIFAPAKPTPL